MVSSSQCRGQFELFGDRSCVRGLPNAQADRPASSRTAPACCSAPGRFTEGASKRNESVGAGRAIVPGITTLRAAIRVWAALRIVAALPAGATGLLVVVGGRVMIGPVTDRTCHWLILFGGPSRGEADRSTRRSREAAHYQFLLGEPTGCPHLFFLPWSLSCSLSFWISACICFSRGL